MGADDEPVDVPDKESSDKQPEDAQSDKELNNRKQKKVDVLSSNKKQRKEDAQPEKESSDKKQPDEQPDNELPAKKEVDGAEFEVESADAGASVTFPMQCSALRKNGFVVIKSRPCKIVDMSTSKTGKHGHAKVHLVAIDIFTGKKLEEVCPSTHNMDVPHVRRQEYLLVDITDDGYLNMVTDDGATKDDIRLPVGDLGDRIRKLFEEESKDTIVVIQSAMGEELAIDAKEVLGK